MNGQPVSCPRKPTNETEKLGTVGLEEKNASENSRRSSPREWLRLSFQYPDMRKSNHNRDLFETEKKSLPS
jgi:hypothetical protein